MRTKSILAILVLVLMVRCTSKETVHKPALAPTKPVEDTYFGTKVTDPYRYMENLQDSSVINWFKDQSDYAVSILNRIPGRKKLIDKMVEFDGRRSSAVSQLNITENDKYFYLKTTPSDQTGKLYFRDGFNGEEVFLFDPGKYGSDTTKKYVISEMTPSIDGSKVAFSVAPNGSENSEILIMNVKDKSLYPEKIDRCWVGGMSWIPDGNSFLYNRLNSGNVHQKDRELNSKTFLHITGTDPETDKEIFSGSKYPELGIKPEDIPVVTYDNDSRYIFGILYTVDNRLNVYYAPYSELKKEKIYWKHLFKSEDEIYNFSTTDKYIYVYTPKNAPNYKILRTSLTQPDLAKAEIIVPEDPKRPLTSYVINKDGLYYTLSENGVSEKLFFLPNDAKSSKEITLPFAAGTVALGSKGYRFNDAWVMLTGWTNPVQRYRYMMAEDKFGIENLSTMAKYPEYDSLKVEEIMVPSYDGIQVPLSLIYKKDIKKDGNTPVLLYGYGAYGISMDPMFNPDLLLWPLNNGILAIAHVRGGGELGDKWYKAGFKTTKPNTWKDLIACTEYLVNNKYTSAGKTAMTSASAGGILIGRAMTERPDLFAAAIPQVGCLNPVRAEESPNGPVNTPEFGTVKDSVECMALLEMDSYLHTKNGVKYPATLITAGMNDPRVIAWQPAKFAARLEADNTSDKPILFLVDYEAGHGIGNTKIKNFERLADVLSFAFWQTGQPDFQLK